MPELEGGGGRGFEKQPDMQVPTLMVSQQAKKCWGGGRHSGGTEEVGVSVLPDVADASLPAPPPPDPAGASDVPPSPCIQEGSRMRFRSGWIFNSEKKGHFSRKKNSIITPGARTRLRNRCTNATYRKAKEIDNEKTFEPAGEVASPAPSHRA